MDCKADLAIKVFIITVYFVIGKIVKYEHICTSNKILQIFYIISSIFES